MFKVGDRVEVKGGWGGDGRNGKGVVVYFGTVIVSVLLDTGKYIVAYIGNVNHYVEHVSPPHKITQNGYEYSLVGPVKPEWLVEGAWVVDKETGRKYRVSCENGVYTLNNGTREVIIDFISLPTRFRPHTSSDWKWGDWAMYEGKRVFVLSSLTHDNLVGVSFPNIDGKDLTDPSDQWDFAEVSELTPTF